MKNKPQIYTKKFSQSIGLILATLAGASLFANSAALDLKSNNSDLNKSQDLNDVDITYIVNESDRRAFELGEKTLISSGQQCDLVLAKFSFTDNEKLTSSNGLDIVFDSKTGESTKVNFSPSEKEISVNYLYEGKSSSGKAINYDKELTALDSEQPIYLILQKSSSDRISIGATNQWPDKDKNEEVNIRFFKTPLTADYQSIDFVNNSANLQVEDISFYECDGNTDNNQFASTQKSKENIYY